MGSDNPTGEPDYQQGRLGAYLSGFADGEGTFSIGLQRRPDLRFGYQIVPEFRVSQNEDRAEVLELFRSTLGCGRIAVNHRGRSGDRTLVFVVRNRKDLVERVIPFFDANPILSSKAREFDVFRRVVIAMTKGEHLERKGFDSLVRIALSMNGEGRYRKWRLDDVIGPRTLRGHTPDTDHEDR